MHICQLCSHTHPRYRAHKNCTLFILAFAVGLLSSVVSSHLTSFPNFTDLFKAAVAKLREWVHALTRAFRHTSSPTRTQTGDTHKIYSLKQLIVCTWLTKVMKNSLQNSVQNSDYHLYCCVVLADKIFRAWQTQLFSQFYKFPQQAI